MSETPASISFDRDAEIYDASRGLDPGVIGAAIDLVESELRGRGRVLEVGVGTGMIALPLAERGIDVVGLDLSAAMMAKLVEKAGGLAPFPLLRGDATRLPFSDATFGATYARHVLHLIRDWRAVVGELCRIVRSGGLVLIAPGAYTGEAGYELSRLIRDEAGAEAADVGLDLRTRPGDLEQAFASNGAVGRDLPEIRYPSAETIGSYLAELEARNYSWTWRVPDDRLGRAIEVGRSWALEHYGSLDARIEEEGTILWRAYDIGR